MLTAFLSIFKEKQCKVYDLQMISKYNHNEILAIKMLAFSSLNGIVNLIYIISFFCIQETKIGFLKLLVISICSLFIFSAFMTFTILKNNSMLAMGYFQVLGLA